LRLQPEPSRQLDMAATPADHPLECNFTASHALHLDSVFGQPVTAIWAPFRRSGHVSREPASAGVSSYY
jgi:hypothetical protein